MLILLCVMDLLSTCQAVSLYDFPKTKGEVRPGTSDASKNYSFTGILPVKVYSLLLVPVIFPLLTWFSPLIPVQKSLEDNKDHTFKMSQRGTVFCWCSPSMKGLFFLQSFFFFFVSLITVAVPISCHLLWACEHYGTELFTFNLCSLCWVSCSRGQIDWGHLQSLRVLLQAWLQSITNTFRIS